MRRAFSLLEVLFAIGILAVGLIGIASLFMAGMHQHKEATHDFDAKPIAQNVLALIQASDPQERAVAFADADKTDFRFIKPDNMPGVLKGYRNDLHPQYPDGKPVYGFEVAYRLAANGKPIDGPYELVVLVYRHGDGNAPTPPDPMDVNVDSPTGAIEYDPAWPANDPRRLAHRRGQVLLMWGTGPALNNPMLGEVIAGDLDKGIAGRVSPAPAFDGHRLLYTPIKAIGFWYGKYPTDDHMTDGIDAMRR